MSNYILSKALNYAGIGQPDFRLDEHKSVCVDFDTLNEAVVRNGRTIGMSSNELKTLVEQRYGQSPVLAVGDTIELFEMPTYSRLADLSVFHDAPMGSFAFEIEVANIAEVGVTPRTVTARTGLVAIKDTEAGNTVTYGTAAAAFTGATGGAGGREHYHFGEDVRNNHRATVRLRITNAPAVPAIGQPAAPNFFDLTGLNFYASFERYASCVCANKALNSYKKADVTTVA